MSEENYNDDEDYEVIEASEEEWEQLELEEDEREKGKFHTIDHRKAEERAKRHSEEYPHFEDPRNIEDVTKSQKTHPENGPEEIISEGEVFGETEEEQEETRHAHEIRPKVVGENRPEESPSFKEPHSKFSNDQAYRKFEVDEKLLPIPREERGIKGYGFPKGKENEPAPFVDERLKPEKISEFDYHRAQATEPERPQSSYPTMRPEQKPKTHPEGDKNVTEEKQSLDEGTKRLAQAFGITPFEREVSPDISPEFKEKPESEEGSEEVEEEPTKRRTIKRPPQVSKNLPEPREISDLSKKKPKDIEQQVREQELQEREEGQPRYSEDKKWSRTKEVEAWNYPYPQKQEQSKRHLKPEDIDLATQELIEAYKQKKRYEEYGSKGIYRVPTSKGYVYHDMLCELMFIDFDTLALHMLKKHPLKEAEELIKRHVTDEMIKKLPYKRGYTDKVTDQMLSDWAEKETKVFIEVLSLKAKQAEKHPEILTGLDFSRLSEFLSCSSDSCVCPLCRKEAVHEVFSQIQLSQVQAFMEPIDKLEETNHPTWKSLSFNNKMKSKYPMRVLDRDIQAALGNAIHLSLHPEFLGLCESGALSGDLITYLLSKKVSRMPEEAKKQYETMSMRQNGVPKCSYNEAFSKWLMNNKKTKARDYQS